jgi:hypothetical protein
MTERIVIDGQGHEKFVSPTSPFPDKKFPLYDYTETTDLLKRARQITKESSVGQKEATWIPDLQYPLLPMAIVLMSDLHYGSINVDYDLLDSHFKIVEDTPNFYLCTNGDHTDSFAPTKHPSGMFENPLPPHFQAKALFQRLLELDKLGKIGSIAHGNHDLFGFDGGQDYYETFAKEFNAPIFDRGGLLNIQTAAYTYRMVHNHTFWGRSKINITNAAKRLIEYEGGGDADIGWVAHTHQSSYELFTKGPKEQVAVVSGTYKVDDPWAERIGIGGRSGHPGITLLLWPTERRMEVMKDIRVAQNFILSMIFREESK